jgi:hypothetical protein
MAGRGVDRVFERRLAALVNSREPQLLIGGLRGLERESLRVTPAGRIATTPHPSTLGSALTNPHVTTDYSEALTELVTPAFADNGVLLGYLGDLHRFVYEHLGEELLWASSMPCELRDEEEVPIARYGNSHRGRVKHIYRQGLKVRYGGMMQAISGVHFNYSGIPVSTVFRPAAQLPPPRLARAVPVRSLAGPVPFLPAGTRRLAAAGAGPGHAHRRACDLAAHERHRLSQSRPGCRPGVGE